MKKILSLLLLVVLLLGVLCPTLVSCEEEEETTVSTVEVEGEYNGLEARDFGGRKITFLTYYEPYNEAINTMNEVVGEVEGDPVQRAVYERNVIMQDKYNITFDYISTRSNTAPIGEVENYYMAQTGEIDYILAGTMANFICGIRGYTVSVNNIPHVQLDKEWWYDDFLTETTIAGKNFFLMGDFAYTSWSNSMATIINEDLARAQQISPEEIYDLIRDGKWTFEKFVGYTSSVHEDVDGMSEGGSEVTGGDIFGFYGSGPTIDALLAASNITFLKEQNDGSLKFGLDPKFIPFYDEVWELLHAKTSLFIDATEWVNRTDITHSFNDGRSVFTITSMPYRDSVLRDVEFKYLYLPLPKWTESQDKYYSWCHQYNCSSVTMMRGSDLDTLGYIIEDFTFYSMKTVRPGYYDTLVEGMIATNETFIEMLDYIVGIYSIDRASLFATDGVTLLAGKSGDIRAALQNERKPGYTSAIKQMSQWQTRVDDAVEKVNSQQ
ncbi:MAG: hypothetical protein J6U86_01520 [Clostridia bacterium]|nr:hypothetical protein [Clostridia bacterium]